MHVVLLGGVAVTPRQVDLMKGTADFVGRPCEGQLDLGGAAPRVPSAVLRRVFADLLPTTGRRSVPPRIVATVMVRQRWFGFSDHEAVQAFEFGAR